MQRFKVRRLLTHWGRGRKFATYISIGITVFLLVMGSMWRSPAIAATARHYTELELGSPPEVQLPDYTRFEMENGLVVYLVEDHELPLVTGTALIHTGGRLEPADQVGLADITGEVMRSGGTLAHPADTLNEILEQRAASVETGIDTVSGSASFNALSEDLPEVLNLFAEVLRQPAFPQDKIDLAKSQRRGIIARRNDSPDDIASREFQKLLYGADSPYARTIEYATIDNIARSDVERFYQQYFYPNNMLLGVVGDFDTDEMRSLLEAALGDWEPNPDLNIEPMVPEVDRARAGGVFLIDQPQLTQSYVQIGHLGGRLDSPDYAPLSVVNEILNGFGGRLVNEVRSRQGLAYVVYAFWSPRYDYPGVFVGGGQTQSQTTVPFVESVIAELERIRTAPVTEEELTRAKDSVLNAFIFNFQTPDQTVARLMRYEYYDYPQDFIFSYQQEVEETTIEDVQRAAQEHLKPDQIVTLVVGKEADIQPSLAVLQPTEPVRTLDITIPEPSAAQPVNRS